MRRIVDTIREQRRPNQRIDTVLLSAEAYDLMCKSWCEMAPENTPMPMVIEDVKLTVGDTRGHLYALLRDYIPWEKRRAKCEGENLYTPGTKKLIGTVN